MSARNSNETTTAATESTVDLTPDAFAETTTDETTPAPAPAESEGQTLDQIITDGLTKDLYSPYELAKAVNALLRDLGVLHSFGTDEAPGLRPQMFYNYVAQGMIKASGAKGDKGRKILKADALEWATKYFAKNVLPKLQAEAAK